jgi:uncharacterized protein YndB with AHSA1/START domain
MAAPASEPTKPSATAPKSGPIGDRETLVTRDFDAPRELVWSAFVDPKHVPMWWGPRGFTCETHEIDIRVGGRWRFTMHGPDGKAWPNRMEYRELKAPERIVVDHGTDVDDDPARFRSTITLEDLGGGRTRVRMQARFATAAQRDAVLGFHAIELGVQTLDKGAAHVASRLFVETHPTEPRATLRRLLHAPRALVWEAMTRPEHLACWYGPRSTKVTHAEIDLRVGGKWRVVMRGDDGREHAFGGEYLELAAPERITQTWRWEGAPEASSIERMRLIDLGDRTLVEAVAEHTSLQNLRMHVEHGMEQGANETYERLDTLLGDIERAPHGIVLERTFAAPRALLFEAWTKTDHFSKWFGPKGVSVPACDLDPRPGGAIRFCHVLAGGPAVWIEGQFDVVEPNERIVFTLRFVDEHGAPSGPPSITEWPKDASIQTTVTWTDAPGGTHQVVRQVIQPEAARDTAAARSECAMARRGWAETLDNLAGHVEKT